MQQDSPPSWIMPVLLCLVAFGLRLGPLWANRFHSDEALYATWALAIATWARRAARLALRPTNRRCCFTRWQWRSLILGHVEVAARLAGLMAGVVSVALVWRLADLHRLEEADPTAERRRDGDGAFAVCDSVFAHGVPRPADGDVCAGFARGRDAQAAWLGRRVAGTGCGDQSSGAHLFAAGRRFGDGSTFVVRRWSFVALRSGLVIPVIARPGVGSAARRRAVLDSADGQLWRHPARVRQRSDAAPGRLGELGCLTFSAGRCWSCWSIGLPLLLIYDLTRGARTRPAALDLTLIAFALGYFFLHWLLAFPVWDRYLLGLVPVMCLLLGRLAGWLSVGWLQRIRSTHVAGLMAVALVVALHGPFRQRRRRKAHCPWAATTARTMALTVWRLICASCPTARSFTITGWAGRLRYYLWDAPCLRGLLCHAADGWPRTCTSLAARRRVTLCSRRTNPPRASSAR